MTDNLDHQLLVGARSLPFGGLQTRRCAETTSLPKGEPSSLSSMARTDKADYVALDYIPLLPNAGLGAPCWASAAKTKPSNFVSLASWDDDLAPPSPRKTRPVAEVRSTSSPLLSCRQRGPAAVLTAQGFLIHAPVAVSSRLAPRPRAAASPRAKPPTRSATCCRRQSSARWPAFVFRLRVLALAASVAAPKTLGNDLQYLAIGQASSYQP